MTTKISLQELPLEQLRRGRYQPRREFDPQALAELADSIRSSGLIQPVVVRPLLGNHGYEIIAGERRWRAAGLAKLATIPCIIHDYNNEQAAAVSTIENLQREDLNPIEEAHALQRLIDEFNHSHDEVAAIVGKSRTKVTNSLRLLRLDHSVQELLISRELSEGHGKMLASLEKPEQLRFAEQTIQQAWSVRRLEQIIKNQRTSTENNKASQANQADIARLKRSLSDYLGANVELDVNHNARGGWLKVQFIDNDTLEGLLDKIGLATEE